MKLTIAAIVTATAMCWLQALADKTGVTRVACIGNSITYGYKLPEREKYAYPSQLQQLLGPEYLVGNFGHSGATLLKHGHRPYNKTEEYTKALEFNPDIAVIHLGINDTDPRNWPNYNSEFIGDYLSLIDTLRSVNPDVRIILAELTPLRAGHPRFETGTRDWRLEIQKAIRTVADKAGVELIDFNAPLRDRQDELWDNVHPWVEGARLLAETAYSGITGDYGGLSLPAIWQDGMVVQRDRPLDVHGTADAGTKVAVILDNRRYSTTADNRGQWSVTTAPLVTGPEYSMRVTAGSDTLDINGILAGEVWIASGQSNMEFYLDWAKGGGKEVDNARDTLLRFYDMKEIARTDAVLWPDSIREQVNRLEYYRPSVWTPATTDYAGWYSAVAYWFGRQLRDSLDVPVGIISNPVGGSPTESWIDINTLEREIPGILRDPRHNDYLQPWVQSRIDDNIGKDTDGRHPYEPSYLFAAGVRPLGGYPVRGAIWYQGESNAHNIELHERLFPLLVQSWREEFGNDTMPFNYVQLSSLDRPSWPEFRDSQRRLASRVPHTAMAVSSDLGDSLDVHPWEKRPVGERLARIALHNTYGFNDLEWQGPTLASARADGNRITLTFSHANGLKARNGGSPIGFEIAETEGIYYPATAVTNDNTVTLMNENVSKPRYVRYGWQPYTRADLVNSAGLPASTFKAEVGNAADYDFEPGYDKGVSAPFCGLVDGRFVIAGGCNFPVDPMGPASGKKSYRGIYAARTGDLQWERIGTLPEETAYGASAMTPKGVVWAGGVTPSGASHGAWLYDGKELLQLPDLPAAVDNAYAAAIGNTVYIAGGNICGKPGNNLYCLDLDNLQRGWVKLKSFPGNPRVQPVLASSGGKLYMWGGFAGRGDKRDATLETSGLCYDPKSGKWSPVATPVDKSGETISLGGGVAVTLPDGRIAVAGGVNKDVFLEALQCQAPDYLQHPIDWYRFNPNVSVYDPVPDKWEWQCADIDLARAGAAAVCPGKTMVVYGGELKPRIRTNSTVEVSF